MRAMLRTTFVTLVALATCAESSSPEAQSSAVRRTKGGMIEACSLMTNAEIEKITGRRLYDAPEATTLVGGTGSACTYGTGAAQIILFQGENSDERWNAFLKAFHRENETKYPVSGVGLPAHALFPKPRNEYEDAVAFLVVKVGQDTLGVSMQVDKSRPADAALPDLVTLAKTVIAKLR